MLIRTLLFCLAFVVGGTPAAADEGKPTLGFARLFSNDVLGDGRDRWRSGAYVVSWMRGRDWTGTPPDRAFDIVEIRARADILAPASLSRPAPGDRPYAASLSFSGQTHWRRDRVEFSAGAGLTLTGPMTGVGEFQRLVHDMLGIAPPTGALNGQIGNRVSPRFTIEAGRRFEIGGAAALRPFVQAETGPETIVRIGGEALIGAIWSDTLFLRDEGTGQLYTGLRGARRGLGLVIGADIARVGDSIWLPSSRGMRLTEFRSRARAGLRWQGERSAAFYGISYLGPEFRGQTQGQFVGSITLDIRF